MNKIFLYIFVFFFIYYGLSALINLAEKNKSVPIIISQSYAEGFISSKRKITFNNCRNTHIDCFLEKYKYSGTFDFKNIFQIENSYLNEFNVGDKVHLVINYYSDGKTEYHINLNKYH